MKTIIVMTFLSLGLSEVAADGSQHDATKCLEDNGSGLKPDADCTDCSRPPKQGCADGYIMTSFPKKSNPSCTDIICTPPDGCTSSSPCKLGGEHCSSSKPCGTYQGDCDSDEECAGDLVCVPDAKTGLLKGGGEYDFCRPKGEQYQGCYVNKDKDRVGGHEKNLTYEECAAKAGGGFFGMEYPQGYSEPGHAQCLLLPNGLPSMRKVGDAECEREKDSFGRRLGNAYRLAVYGHRASGKYKKGVEGSNACPKGYDHIKNHADCKEAGEALDTSLHRTPSGSWSHVPPYCSYQSGGDKSVHFNTKSSGKNHGGYTPICRRDPQTVDKHLKKSVPHTMDMISLNVLIYNGYKAGDTVKAKTTGNPWKVVQDMSDSGKTGRLWLAEFEKAKTCAIVVRGTDNAEAFLQNMNVLPERMPGTDYMVVKGYQDHILDIMKNNNNSKKIEAWLQKCHDKGFKKIFSGHSLGGTVATWLSMWFETKKESLRADFVVTFGQPRLVTKYGADRCPRSLQTRTKAVRIVTATTGSGVAMSWASLGGGIWVDAAATLPGEMNPQEKFCFESLSLDDWGNLVERDAQWPNWSYEITVNSATGGWELHSSESRYQPYLIKVREKVEANRPCYVSERCDNIGNYWGKGSCKDVCCHGAEWKIFYHVCKAEKCMAKGTWCDINGILTASCDKCCSKSATYKWDWWRPWRSAHYCD